MGNMSDEILKAIKLAVERHEAKCDRTYESVI